MRKETKYSIMAILKPEDARVVLSDGTKSCFIRDVQVRLIKEEVRKDTTTLIIDGWIYNVVTLEEYTDLHNCYEISNYDIYFVSISK